MPIATGVEVQGDGAVVVKRVSGGAAAVESLRREGERLRRAAHPGVVSLVRSAPTPDGWELVMAHGGRPLSTLDRCPVGEAAAIVAALASTMADLHDLGVTHGRIDPSHVLVGDNGRPRLCGFGDGTDAASAFDDVAALGCVLDGLLGSELEPEPMPERRWVRRSRGRGWERRALLSLADQATADDPGHRPTARRLAAAIATAVPSSEVGEVPNLSDLDDPIERLRPAADDGPSPSRRQGLPLALAIGGAALALAGAVRFQSDSTSPTELAPPMDAPSPSLEVAEPVMDSVLVADGRRYRVGQPGDHLVVGDWACDGHPTPAAFRPSTHEVFVFDRWTATAPLVVPATARVPDAVELLSRTRPDGCAELAVRTAGGEVVPVGADAR